MCTYRTVKNHKLKYRNNFNDIWNKRVKYENKLYFFGFCVYFVIFISIYGAKNSILFFAMVFFIAAALFGGKGNVIVNALINFGIVLMK